MTEGEGTTATAQIEDITTTTMMHTEALREHLTMTVTGTTGDTVIGEKHQNTIGDIGGMIKEIDTPTTTEAGPIPVPDPGLL
jgi:hypothetical protein